MMIIISLSGILSGCQMILPIPDEAQWTVMVYMAADNNLESVAVQDFNEMEKVGSTQDVNIVVQIDRVPFDVLNQSGQGFRDDDSNSNWTGTRRYYIIQDMNRQIINSTLIKDLGEQNMGDPATLKDFTQWAIQNYPAQKYLLVLWNHGGGFRSLDTDRDICEDNTDDDIITMPQLEESLSFIESQLGKKIDIIGMDACLMAMVEVAYQIKDYAQIMIASQANIPQDGWQYDCILQALALHPGQADRQLSAEIVNCYFEQYSGSGKNVTLSAIDLDLTEDLAENVSKLAHAVMNDSYTSKNAYREARNASQNYTGLGFEYIDLKDYVNQLPDYTSNSQVLSAAIQINQILESGNIIINETYNGNDVKNSNGLSIYYPYYSYDSQYEDTNFARDIIWDEMLVHLGL